MDTNGIVDVLNALPTAKLITTVSAGIGKLYEPTHIKRMAKAKAEEIKLISGAMEACSVVPTQYSSGEIQMNTSDWDDFVRRTQGRMAFQELQKQNNIECVVAKAYNVLENEESCSVIPVEQGWINRFFDSVADVSDDDLQKLWGKVLAGEIKQPKSYSLRTLETLKNISKHEAELFQKVASFVTIYENDYFLISDTDILKKYSVFYEDILSLDECGLINSSGFTVINPEVSIDKLNVIYNKSNALLLKGLSDTSTKISFGIFVLTRAGKELYSILDCGSNEKYIYDLAEKIEKSNHGKVNITVHGTKFLCAERVEWYDTVLCEFPKKVDEV